MDEKLKMICGLPISVGPVELIPFTVREIVNIGYDIYMSTVGILCFDSDYFLKILRTESIYMEIYEQRHTLKSLDYYMMFSLGDFGEMFRKSLSIILRIDLEKISFRDNHIVIETSDDDEKLIDGETYDDIVRVIKYQNTLKRFESETEEDENPADEKTKELLAKIKANRERVNKAKSEESDAESETTDFYTIISAVTVRSNSINKINVNDLTLFQVYDEFSRLQLIDGYENYIKASMVGAKIEGKTPHWSNKI